MKRGDIAVAKTKIEMSSSILIEPGAELEILDIEDIPYVTGKIIILGVKINKKIYYRIRYEEDLFRASFDVLV